MGRRFSVSILLKFRTEIVRLDWISVETRCSTSGVLEAAGGKLRVAQGFVLAQSGVAIYRKVASIYDGYNRFPLYRHTRFRPSLCDSKSLLVHNHSSYSYPQASTVCANCLHPSVAWFGRPIGTYDDRRCRTYRYTRFRPSLCDNTPHARHTWTGTIPYHTP